MIPFMDNPQCLNQKKFKRLQTRQLSIRKKRFSYPKPHRTQSGHMQKIELIKAPSVIRELDFGKQSCKSIRRSRDEQTNSDQDQIEEDFRRLRAESQKKKLATQGILKTPMKTRNLIPRQTTKSSASVLQNNSYQTVLENIQRLVPALQKLSKMQKRNRLNSDIQPVRSASPASGFNREKQNLIQRTAITPQPQRKYYFPQLLEPLQPPQLSVAQKQLIAKFHGYYSEEQFQKKIKEIIQKQNPLLHASQSKCKKSIKFDRIVTQNQDESKLDALVKYIVADFRTKLSSINEKIDQTIQIATKRFLMPPIQKKATRPRISSRYLNSSTKLSEGRGSQFLFSKKQTGVSRGSLRSPPQIGSQMHNSRTNFNLIHSPPSSNRNVKPASSLQKLKGAISRVIQKNRKNSSDYKQERSRKVSKQLKIAVKHTTDLSSTIINSSPGKYSKSVTQNSIISPPGSRKTTLQRPGKAVKFSDQYDQDFQDKYKNYHPLFITQGDMAEVQRLEEEQVDDQKKQKKFPKMKLRQLTPDQKAPANFKQVQKAMEAKMNYQINIKYAPKILVAQGKVNQLQEELLIGLGDDSNGFDKDKSFKKKTISRVTSTIAQVFQTEQKAAVSKNQSLLASSNKSDISKQMHMPQNIEGTKKQQDIIKQEINKFIQKHEFFGQISRRQKQKKYLTDKDIRDNFVEACIRAKVVPLPMLSKLRNGVLNLENYKLNHGLCQALGKTILRHTKGIQKLLLINNGMQDQDLAQILEGLVQNKQVKCLNITANDIGGKSVEVLGKILNREKNIQIQQLRINKEKGSPHHLNKLLDLMTKNCKLKLLGLSQSSLNDISVSLIQDFICQNNQLESLDISFNKILQGSSLSLIHSLKTYSTDNLMYLDLSWNCLGRAELTFDKFSNKNIGILTQLSRNIATQFAKFLRESYKLLHLNLAATGLQPQQALTIFRAVRRSKSLLSIHVGGNKLSYQIREEIRQILKSNRFRIYRSDVKMIMEQKWRKMSNKVDELLEDPYLQASKVEQEEEQKQLNYGNAQDSKISTNLQKLQIFNNQNLNKKKFLSPKRDNASPRMFQNKNSKEMTVFQKHQVKNNQQNKNYNFDQKNYIDQRDLVIYTRVLGHPQIDKSRIWYQTNQCWVCQKWSYTIVIWNKHISKKIYIQSKDFDKQGLLQKIDKANLFSSIEVEKDRLTSTIIPRIAGTFTDWKQRQMLPVTDFCERLVKSWNDQKQKQFDIKGILSRSNQRKLGLKMIREMNKNSQNNQSALKLEMLKVYSVFWPEIIEQLSKYQPQYAGATLQQAAEQRHEAETYIWASFVPAGKHSYSIVYNKQNQAKMHADYNKVIIHKRDYPLEISLKKTKKIENSRVFIKEKSVFRDWKKDDQRILQSSLFSDLSFSKLNRMIKDPDELREVEEVLLKYVEPLKDLFTFSICNSDFPSISWLDFSKLCQRLKFIDKFCSISAIDQAFIAVNVEIQEVENNPDRDLCRYQFYQIMARIARIKYKQPKKVDNLQDATEKLIQECVIKNMQIEPWQQYRDDQLWTLDVNDMLQANIESIRTVYITYLKPSKKFLNLPACHDLFIRDAKLSITEKDVVFCYGYSKMTIVDEMKSKLSYERLMFVEFLEMIGRIAGRNFNNTEIQNQNLVVKISLILDIILPLVGLRRVDPEIDFELESQSENEF